MWWILIIFGVMVVGGAMIIRRWCENCKEITPHTSTMEPGGWETIKCNNCGDSKSYKTS